MTEPQITKQKTDKRMNHTVMTGHLEDPQITKSGQNMF